MNNIKDYHNGWPLYGNYKNKLNEIELLLYNYLVNFPLLNKRLTVIFDIDDTLLYTDPADILYLKDRTILQEIKQIGNILRLCRNLGFKIIILTARPTRSYSWSVNNLNYHNLPFDEIYHNLNYPDINFKVSFKQELSLKENIILSVGDQWPDLQGLKDCLCIKLPSIQDINAYFTFNNINYYRI